MSALSPFPAAPRTSVSETVATFRERGYVVAAGQVPIGAIDLLLQRFVSLLNRVSGQAFVDAHAPDVGAYLNTHKDVQALVYDEIRKPDWLAELSSQKTLIAAVSALIGPDIGLLKKIPLRIDAPMETAQYAVWHQDYFYVRGNQDIVTAWIPLQDTRYINGCLSVMPGSHQLGPVEHDGKVLGKRDYPSNVFDREVRYVEVKRGDAILFHSCLLHSSSLNLSTSVRFSVQARYTPIPLPVDPGMGGVIPLVATGD